MSPKNELSINSKISTRPKIVFAPNQKNSERFGEVFESFKKKCSSGRPATWSCKKTAKTGDIYIFYFARPLLLIAGYAVCARPPDQKGWKKTGWSNRQKMFFAEFKSFHLFKNPISDTCLKEHPALQQWWKTKPYRGRPKEIAQDVFIKLLQVLSNVDAKSARRLQRLAGVKPFKKVAAVNRLPIIELEGTLTERLVRQASRSKKLRDEKIYEVLRKFGCLACEVEGCRFDFAKVYGDLGKNYAHVHHRTRLADRGKRSTSLSDLAIVCANCHAMIHRDGKCRSLEELIPNDLAK